jgi:hypothetical protein
VTRKGALIAGAGGALLFASLFLVWYDFAPPGAGLGESVGDVIGLDLRDRFDLTGWEAFDITDLVCAAAGAIATVRGGIVLLGGDDDPEVPGSVFTAGFGVAAAAMIAYRIANPPGVGYEREIGVWLGMAGALAIAYGSVITVRASDRFGDRGRV